MKCLPLLILGSAMLVGGCASTDTGATPAVAAGEESYVVLGSNIPKKGKKSAEGNVNLQQLENDRQMNVGANANGAGGR